MPKLKVTLKAPKKGTLTKTEDVLVTLPIADYNRAWLQAQSHNQTVAEWIASLVNTALMP